MTQHKLVALANSYAEECSSIFVSKTNTLLKSYEEWLYVSEVECHAQMLSAAFFFMHCARTKVEKNESTC